MLETMKGPAAADYAEFPDFEGMETRGKLREYAAYTYLNIDSDTAVRLALEFMQEDPFASRICALILDRSWRPAASRALLDLAGKSSWTATIATALQVLKRRDPGMYITALQMLRKELEDMAPEFRTPVEQFRYYLRRKRLVQAFGICREKALVKTLANLLDPKDRGQALGKLVVSEENGVENSYHRSVTEEALVAIQEILEKDFGYLDNQSADDRQAVIERCKRFVRTRM
ncbi:MAG: hypothetical protein ABIH23_03740 [bacterium]